MASMDPLLVKNFGGIPFLLQGTELVCELPEWVDHTARIKTVYEPQNMETKLVLVQPNHPAQILDRETKKWRPL